MNREQRKEVLRLRKLEGFPWHSPPHFDSDHPRLYHLSAACYEHKPFLGVSPERLARFEDALVKLLGENDDQLLAWCVLPTHWHVLVRSLGLKETVERIGKLHGRTSFEWNGAENCRGRKCWHGCADRAIRSERHKWATINYIHHNLIHHGYVKRWQDWPYSSAAEYLRKAGRKQALEYWRKYPVLDYGKGWDDPKL